MKPLFYLLLPLSLIFAASPVLAVNIPRNFLPPKWSKMLCAPAAPQCDFPPSVLISVLLPNILILAGVIFFFLMLGGGFMMIKSAGGDANAQDTAKAKNAVTFAVIGFLLVISAYFILQIVGTVTGVDFVNPKVLR